jgi:hypothetical protein
MMLGAVRPTRHRSAERVSRGWLVRRVSHERDACQLGGTQLEHAKDKAVREVWKAYDDTKVAMAKQLAATALLDASEKAWAATLESYRNGLVTFPDVRESERTWPGRGP